MWKKSEYSFLVQRQNSLSQGNVTMATTPHNTHTTMVHDHLAAFNSESKFNPSLSVQPTRLCGFPAWKSEESMCNLFPAKLSLPPSYPSLEKLLFRPFYSLGILSKP